MRLTGSRAYARPAPTPTMPPGLVDLMEGLAKDVLKNSPENIYEFCAGHMQKLLEIRDGPLPSKKHLSLEEKVAKAQEKIRKRMKNKELQQNKNNSQPSSDNREHDNEQPVGETPILNLESVIQPVIHGEELGMANEVEIFHEPDVTIATNDVREYEASELEPKVEKDIAVAMQTLGTEKSCEKVNGKTKEDTSDHMDKVVESIAVAIQTAELEKSTEKVKREANENPSEDTKQPSNPEPIVELQNVTIENHDLENKKTEFTESTETVDKNTEDEKIQLDEAKLSVDKDDNAAVDETVTLKAMENLEKTESQDELHETVSTQPLGNHSEALVSNANDTLQTKGVMNDERSQEEETAKKEEIKDVNDEDLLIEKSYINTVNKESANSNTLAIDDKKKLENSDDLLPKPEEFTAGVLNDNNQPDIPQQTETPLNKTQIEHSTETEAPDTANPEVGNEMKLLEDKVITVEIAENIVDDGFTNKNGEQSGDLNNDLRENKLDRMASPDKQVINTDNKLPERERASSEELIVKENNVIQNDNDTRKVDANNTMIEGQETTENTAVSGMDLETAAITIQKVFRTFLFSKSRASTLDDNVMGNSLEEDIEKKDEPQYVLTNTNLNKERRALGISRMDTVLQTVNEEKSLSLSDESSLSSAATTIQAHVRGFLVRNRFASNKTASSSSLVNSDGPSTLSLDGDTNEPKKTILNIHIVPERGQFMSRDESLLTSIDLPLDNSPPSSINLHPLGYDKSERRKQLKREDAIQSISPPSNNSGKLSEEVDSVNDATNESVDLKERQGSISMNGHDKPTDPDTESCDTTLTISSTAETVIDADAYHNREVSSSPEHNLEAESKTHETVINSSSDEMDVVTPFPTITEKQEKVNNENDEKPKLLHSGEFHDIVVQTQVKRSETSVVREFKNVLVYFLLWDKT